MTTDVSFVSLVTIADGLQDTAGWQGMTAYERTKRLLEALMRAGIQSPSWTGIRDVIGKGSSGDINRAKRDFLKEHASSLRKMHGAIKGIPEELAQSMMSVWTTAIDHAHKEFTEQVSAWEMVIEQTETGLAEAEQARDDAQARVKELEREMAGVHEANISLRTLAESERASREQAERMFETTLEELKASNAHVQNELGDALTRFEGLERRSLMEIDHARQETREAKDRYASDQAKEHGRHAVEMQRARTQIIEQRTRLTELGSLVTESQNKAIALEAETEALRKQVVTAQQTIQSLIAAKGDNR